MYCLTSVDTFLRKLFLTTLSSLCAISHEYRRRSGKNGGQLIFLGASNFSNLLAPCASGSRSLMLRADLTDHKGKNSAGMKIPKSVFTRAICGAHVLAVHLAGVDARQIDDVFT